MLSENLRIIDSIVEGTAKIRIAFQHCAVIGGDLKGMETVSNHVVYYKLRVAHTYICKATTMRWLVSYQLTVQKCMRAGGLTHYLIIFVSYI